MPKFPVKILILLLLISSCATFKRKKLKKEFDQIQQKQSIWSPQTPPRIRRAVRAFYKKAKLPNGKIYGEIARQINPRKNLRRVSERAQELGCKRYNGFLKKQPHRRQSPPLRYKGKKIPMIFFYCPDGTLIRIKPEGNPLSSHRSWPHGSLSVLSPYNANPLLIQSEAFKVDLDGRALPATTRHLKKNLNPDAWAEDAHFDFNGRY